MICFHHNDMDGKCAGAIVRKYFLEHLEVLDRGERVFMYEVDYGRELPVEALVGENELVVIVDFSPERPEQWEALKTRTNRIAWIDHHKSSIAKYGGGSVPPAPAVGVFRDGTAACILAWEYFFSRKQLPRIVEMLGHYDVWDFSKHGDDLNKLQCGIRLHDNFPESPNWDRWLLRGDGVFSDGLDELLSEGAIVLNYRNRGWASLVKNYAFPCTFEGHSAICCNASGVSSQLFDTVKEPYDLLVAFFFDGEQWMVSLYTKREDIDCSEIAKRHGGGGHRKAAGFECRELPFRKGAKS